GRGGLASEQKVREDEGVGTPRFDETEDVESAPREDRDGLRDQEFPRADPFCDPVGQALAKRRLVDRNLVDRVLAANPPPANRQQALLDVCIDHLEARLYRAGLTWCAEAGRVGGPGGAG